MPKTDHVYPSVRGTLSFFLPLALTSAMTMVSHSLVAAGLARTVNPVASIAAYSVALAVEDAFEAPIIQTRQMTLALLTGPRSFFVIRRVALTALAVSLVLGMLLAITPIGPLIFTDLLGVPSELLQATMRNFWIVMLLPLLAGARAFFQGIVIKHRQTSVMTAAMAGRVVLMGCFIYTCICWGWITGGYIGSVALVVGVSVELVVAAVKARQLLRNEYGEVNEGAVGGEVTSGSVWRFYYPLAVAAVVAAIAKPWIAAGLTRGSDAATALAGYAVAWSLGSIIVNPILNIHQVSLVLGRGVDGDRHARWFSLAAGCFASSLLLLVGFSPLGRIILTNWVGVPVALIAVTLSNLRMMAVLPLILCSLEYLTGLMLSRSLTRVISAAKIISLLTIMAAVALLARTTAAVGPLSQIIGAGAELVALTFGWLRANRDSSLKQELPGTD